jgi:uncharacterized protein YciI
MPFFALQYELVDNFVARRTLFREQHLSMLRKLHDGGHVVMAGALGEPVDRALLIFKGDDPSVAESFAKIDPYVLNGLVKRWEARLWNVVIGCES